MRSMRARWRQSPSTLPEPILTFFLLYYCVPTPHKCLCTCMSPSESATRSPLLLGISTGTAFATAKDTEDRD